MRALVVDPFAGLSGDMFVAALLDLGLGEDWLRDLVASLDLPGVGVAVEQVDRRGIACPHVTFDLPDQPSHRHLEDVLAIVDATAAAPEVKASAARAFRRLAESEAAVHGTPVDRVHFHEVGALDAILDVVCAMAGVQALGVERCFTRAVALGSGWVEIAHGRFPVPAPATLKLLEGLPVAETRMQGECTTPTGAAILATLTEGRTPPSDMRLVASGYGAGTRNPVDRPNCLRLLVVEVADREPDEELLLLQTDVDDLPPEVVPATRDALMEAGALDVVTHGVGMKKGRPGLRIEALVPAPALDGALGALFRETTTIGARFWRVDRPALARSESTMEWRGQRIRRKEVRLPDGTIRAKPEYDDVARAAAALGLSVLEVRRALEALEETGTRVGSR